jgi:predicted nucleotidyltransferase
MSHQQNIVRIKAVANALSALNVKIVFVGGATISLYPDRPVFEVRPTDYIDVIVEILSYSERAALEDRLRANGFIQDVESGIVCRYKIQGIVVDIMPTGDDSIGFSNRWYPDGFDNSVLYEIDAGNCINILSSPYFIATKLEAFYDRGKGDGRTSQDFEDIVFLLENRKVIWDEMNATKEPLKSFLVYRLRLLFSNSNLFEWIDSNVEKGSPPATYRIISELEKFVS